MNITVNNIDKGLRLELSKKHSFVDINKNPKGVFLEWSSVNKSCFKKQTEIIEVCVNKKVPMIIFDRYHEIKDEEVSCLVGNGAFLWEPSISNRSFFSYQPVWGRIITDYTDIPLTDYTDSIDLGHMSSLSKKISTFRDYYKSVSEIGEYRVAYFDDVGNGTINDKVSEMNIPVYKGKPSMPVKVTILLGSDHDYQIGNLDSKLFDYLENGIIPLLPREHRWYHSVFGDMVVDGEDDIEFILKLHNKISFGCIYDIYRNLDMHLPESNVVNVAKRINKYFS